MREEGGGMKDDRVEMREEGGVIWEDGVREV